MLARIPWAALTAGSLCAAVLAYACGVAPSGDCSENGTCPPDGGGADEGGPLDAGGGEDGSGQGDTATDRMGTDTGDEAANADRGDGLVCDPTKDPKDQPDQLRH